MLLDGLVACGVPEVAGAAGRPAAAGRAGAPAARRRDRAPRRGGRRCAPLERRALHAAAAVVATSDGRGPPPGRRCTTCPPAACTSPRPGVDPAPLAEPVRTAAGCSASPRSPRAKARTCWSRPCARGRLPWTCTFVGAPGPRARVRATGSADAGRGAARPGRAGRAADRGRAGRQLRRRRPAGAAVARRDVRHGGDRGAGPRHPGARHRRSPACRRRSGTAPDGTLPGHLVPPGDPEALAAALRAWLTDPALRARLAGRGRARRADAAGLGRDRPDYSNEVLRPHDRRVQLDVADAARARRRRRPRPGTWSDAAPAGRRRW